MMNKYEEALDNIGSLYMYDEDEEADYMLSESFMKDDYDILKELVGKETPKKPVDIEFGPSGDLMLCCPTCKHGVVPIPTYNGNKYYPRCPFCGQKLKEGDEDEK